MRPQGDVRKALLIAIEVAPGSTMRELAAHTKVGFENARRTLDHMVRDKQIVRGPDRVVTYRNRPVATYLPAAAVAVAANDSSIQRLLTSWG